jgi:DNA-directed RNA polymerase sigma subunit (sigma70/sigma32)
MSFEEIAAATGLSKARVHQIYNSAIKKIKFSIKHNHTDKELKEILHEVIALS